MGQVQYQYTVVSETAGASLYGTPDEWVPRLVKKVQNLTDDGWKPCGGIYGAHTDVYYQVLYRRRCWCKTIVDMVQK